MNGDTLRTVNQIKAAGYWRQGTTLGEGGWEAIHKFNKNFREYVLEIGGEVVETIQALDDLTAINAFNGLYNLTDDINWEVYEHIHKFHTIAGNI